MLRLCIIGSGTRAAWMAASLRAVDPEVTLAAVADPDPNLAKQRLKDAGVAFEGTRFLNDCDTMLQDADRFDGVIIGTRCDLHAQMALKVAPTGLPVFLEKPVAIWPDELQALHHAYAGREATVVVSFP